MVMSESEQLSSWGVVQIRGGRRERGTDNRFVLFF